MIYIKDTYAHGIIGTPNYNKKEYYVKKLGKDGQYHVIMKLSNSHDCDKVVNYLNKIDGDDSLDFTPHKERFDYYIDKRVKIALLKIMEEIKEEVLDEVLY